MKISTRGRYALRLCIDIALQNRDQYTTLKEISERQSISIKYLEQITSLLSKAGLVISSRGPSGGYMLSKNPENITVYEILCATEGPLSSVSCLGPDKNPCPRKHICTTLDIWQGLDKVMCDYLSSISLADAVQKENNNKSVLNFSI